MYKVMIVDDKEIVRRELKRLKIWGEETGFIICEEAGNGQEALDLIAKNPVDLIITDIKMPKIDGIELLGAIVEGKLCACVVLLSDYSEFSYARQGIILGAFDYMPKPVNEKELVCLLQRAREYLDNNQKEKERVRKLELFNTESHESYISILNVEKMSELLKTRDQNALNFVSHMLDQIWDSYKVDFNIIENLLQNFMKELIQEIIQSYPWFDKFFDMTQFQTYHFQTDYEVEPVKLFFLNKIKEIISLLDILRCNVQDRGIEAQVCNYVLDHIEDDISLAIVADNLFLNRTYVSEIFKQKTGIPFTEYVTRVKMERAKIIILQDNLKTYEIAEKLGFKDTEYFSKVFKKSTGMTPTEFRKNLGL